MHRPWPPRSSGCASTFSLHLARPPRPADCVSLLPGCDSRSPTDMMSPVAKIRCIVVFSFTATVRSFNTETGCFSVSRTALSNAMVGLAFGVVGIAPIWFILATKRPVFYSVGLGAVGAGLGLGLGCIVRSGDAVVWVTATTTETLALVLSLLVVRSGGYRLARLPRHDHTIDGASHGVIL